MRINSKKICFYILGLILIPIAIMFIFHKPIIAIYVQNLLRERGQQVSFKIESISKTQVVLKNVNFENKTIVAHELQISYFWEDIKKGFIEDIKIFGLEVNSSRLRKLTSKSENIGSSNNTFVIPFKTLSITNLKIFAKDDNFAFDLMGNLQARIDEKIEIRSKFQLPSFKMSEKNIRLRNALGTISMQIDKDIKKFEMTNAQFDFNVEQIKFGKENTFQNLKMKSTKASRYVNGRASIQFNTAVKSILAGENLWLNLNDINFKVDTNLDRIPYELTLSNGRVLYHQKSLGELEFKEIFAKTTGDKFGNFNVQLNSYRVENLGQDAHFRPLDLEIKGTKTNLTSNFQLVVNILDKQKLLQANALFKDMDGAVNYQIGPLDFSKGLKISDFTSKIKIPLKELSGKILAKGKITKNGDEVVPGLTILSKDFSFNYEGMKLNSININHSFDDLTQLRTQKGQSINIAEISVGTALKELLLNYQMRSKEEILFDKILLNTEFGDLKTDEFLLNYNRSNMANMEVSLKNVELQKLLSMALKNNVYATGNLAGDLKVKIMNKKPIISKGLLKSTGKGKIQYQPGQSGPLTNANNVGVNILLDYLKDFNYEDISVEITSDDEYNALIIMKILGNNPQVFNGRALKFKLNLELNIMKLLKSSIGTYNISETLKKRLIERIK